MQSMRQMSAFGADIVIIVIGETSAFDPKRALFSHSSPFSGVLI